MQLKLYIGNDRAFFSEMSGGQYLRANVYTTVFASVASVELGALTNSAILCSKDTCST